MPESRRPVAITTAVAAVLGAAFLIAPPMGTDLSAQVARADFVRAFGTVAIDLRWYGGTNQFGYSLVSAPLMAAFGTGTTGPRVAGTLAAIASAMLLVALFARTGAARPLLGGVIGALCLFGNLVSGRVTYALGIAFGLAGLLALTARTGRWRLVLAAAGVLVASATSPVAGLFLGLAGVALFASGRSLASVWPPASGRLLASGQRRDGLVVAVAAAVPLFVTSILAGGGGWMNISWSDTVRAMVASLAVTVLVPRRVVRIGALLSAAGVLLAFAVHTPVGLNATRLATMFALPVIAGYGTIQTRRVASDRGGWALAVVLVVFAVVSPPVVTGDLLDAGNPTASSGYFAPLVARLAVAGPVGRIEIPPTRDYWESAYAARAVPLARGWLRQVDIGRNPLFFDGGLSAQRYQAWLVDNGVSYVAVPDATLSWVGRGEAALIDAGQPYLTLVWRSDHWSLYQVTDSPSIVDATLVESTGDRVVFDTDHTGDVLVRLQWSDRLRALSAAGTPVCVRPSGRWVTVRVPAPGRYAVTSARGPIGPGPPGCR